MPEPGGSTSGGANDTDLAYDVLRHLLGVVDATKRNAIALAAELDLSLSQLDALKNLGGTPCSQRELAQSLHFDASNVTDIVDRLEARGYAVRTVDPADRRIRRVVLTPEGEAVRRKLFERVLDESPVRKLSAHDLRSLRTLLAKIADPVDLPF